MTPINPQSYIKQKIFSNYNSIEEAGLDIGIDSGTIRRYIRGLRKPSRSVLRVIQLSEFIKLNNLEVPQFEEINIDV
ncbi:MAG: hypothetical protein WBF90_33970 [Rivularia sp. (in: cyanobacteria)]